MKFYKLHPHATDRNEHSADFVVDFTTFSVAVVKATRKNLSATHADFTMDSPLICGEISSKAYSAHMIPYYKALSVLSYGDRGHSGDFEKGFLIWQPATAAAVCPLI